MRAIEEYFTHIKIPPEPSSSDMIMLPTIQRFLRLQITSTQRIKL